jgi:hypothetical protein
MLFLALCHADIELGAAFVPMDVERNEGKASALNSSNQPVELLPVQKQFPIACRVWFYVRRGRIQR